MAKGKKLVFIQTQEADAGAYTDLFAKYSMFFQFIMPGLKWCSELMSLAVGEGDRFYPDSGGTESVAQWA